MTPRETIPMGEKNNNNPDTNTTNTGETKPLSPAHPTSSTNKEIYIVPHNVHKFLHIESF
jgi:hypothetical protein